MVRKFSYSRRTGWKRNIGGPGGGGGYPRKRLCHEIDRGSRLLAWKDLALNKSCDKFFLYFQKLLPLYVKKKTFLRVSANGMVCKRLKNPFCCYLQKLQMN
jgi:hypothetical protein